MRGTLRMGHDVAASRLQMITDWAEGLRVLHVAHNIAAERFERWDRVTAISTAALSTVVGTAIFATLAESSRTAVRIITGILSLAAAALSTAQLIWNYPQLAAQHRAAAVRYATVRRQLDIMLADSGRLTDDNVNAVSATWEDIEKAAPALSRPIRRRARREIADRIARRPTTQITPAGQPRTGA
ncbi:SLATT domain-containing protein [Streptomyces asiaticus]|uniref:SLATT domain-containing protein n=1 Tax=Streptomyces asiaticus TaxID=114695 RepID=UPI003F67C9E3